MIKIFFNFIKNIFSKLKVKQNSEYDINNDLIYSNNEELSSAEIRPAFICNNCKTPEPYSIPKSKRVPD